MAVLSFLLTHEWRVSLGLESDGSSVFQLHVIVGLLLPPQAQRLRVRGGHKLGEWGFQATLHFSKVEDVWCPLGFSPWEIIDAIKNIYVSQNSMHLPNKGFWLQLMERHDIVMRRYLSVLY